MKLHVLAVVGVALWPFGAQAAAVDLGTAAAFGVLGASTVTNVPSAGTVITGDLGVSPGSAITGFPPGIYTGTEYAGDATAATAQADAANAYTVAAGLAPTDNLTGQDLGGLTLTPGVYFFSSSADLTGTLTLNGEGNPNAVFVFQIGSTLTTAATNADVDLINGASGANVFWQVGSSATLQTDTDFVGTIDANTSISFVTGASIACGRAIALNGAVTMDDNSVSTGGCFSPPGGSPIPESSTWAMMLVGFAGLGFAGYRQRRKLVGAASV